MWWLNSAFGKFPFILCKYLNIFTIILKGLLEPGDYILARNGLIYVAIKAIGMENN